MNGQSPEWIGYFDEAELAGVTGGRLLELAHHQPALADEAANLITRAIEARPANVPDQEMRIGVTGHMNLSNETAVLVRERIRSVLATTRGPRPLVGVSCLAAGADTIFAETVIDWGGELEVIVPSLDYRQTKIKPDHAPTFDRLVSQARKVHTLPFHEANRDAYEAANRDLLQSCEALVAVWDGQPPVDNGGTAAVVLEAAERGLEVHIIWPAGARREQ